MKKKSANSSRSSENFARRGSALFVTHFLDQVYEISDRITVLRDGQLLGEYETAKFPRVDLIRKMIGGDLAKAEASQPKGWQQSAGKETLLELKQFGRTGSVTPMDMEISKGEILGLAGLLGSGAPKRPG